LDTLQAMREASPTGGALGQVPIQQQQRLEQVLGSMNLGQNPDDIEANMQRVMNIYLEIINGNEEEIAALVSSGEITPEEAERRLDLKFDLPFDELGRPIDQAQAVQPPLAPPATGGFKVLSVE